MIRVAFVTYRASPRLTADDHPAAEILREQGTKVTAAAWDDRGVEWGSFDGVVVRSCWDYHLQPHTFANWLDAIERSARKVWNEVPTMRWNMRKNYLRDLKARGVATVPTVWAQRGTANHLVGFFDELGRDELIVKPVIGATAHQTWRSSRSDATDDHQRFAEMVARDDVLLQPFLPEIQTEGEWSLIFLDGSYSHAVIKRAKSGDYRSQEEWGGVPSPANPSEMILAAGRRAIGAVDRPTLYARVDFVVVDGQPLLMELELIEPALYLRTHPDAPRHFAEAILRRL